MPGAHSAYRLCCPLCRCFYSQLWVAQREHSGGEGVGPERVRGRLVRGMDTPQSSDHSTVCRPSGYPHFSCPQREPGRVGSSSTMGPKAQRPEI